LKKYTVFTVFIMLGFVFLSACDREITLIDDPQDQIRVVGSATITTSPDTAITQLGVQTYNSEIEPAIDENNRKSDAVQAALIRQGIAEEDMQTTSFNIYPQRDYSNDRPEEIIGYQVSNMVSVVIRDLDSVGEVLQIALDAGANTVSSVSFTLDDPIPFMNEARVKAIEDARQKAESMAQAADIELGKVKSITETSYSVPIATRADYAEDAYKSGVPIQSGELELTMSVEMVFEIP